MKLAGQGGYAMAALLVALSVLAVFLTVALPSWSHMVQREREAELIWRGQQYARAIGLFQRKFPNTFPPSIDLLVEQRFLRKKYKDPITNDEFQPLFASQTAQQAPGGGAPPGRPGAPGTGFGQPVAPAQPVPGAGSGRPGVGTPAGGIIGVVSKSKEEAIKVYNGRTKHDEWQFVWVAVQQQPTAPGQQQPGQQPGQAPSQQQGPTTFNPNPAFPGGQPTRPPVSPGLTPAPRPPQE